VARRGVAFIHQNLGLVEDLSVAENIALSSGYSRTGPFISWSNTRHAARSALDEMGVEIDPDSLVADLPMSARSVTAIARALVQDVRLLVLDEPTATLGVHEADRLFDILRRLRERGVAIIIITHRIEEVLAITDRVTVLRDGHVVGVRASSEVTEHELIQLIIGADLPPRPERTKETGGVILSMAGIHVDAVGPLTLDAMGGEVLGFTGLSGAGHTIVPRLLFGLERIRRGSMTLDGAMFAPARPSDATSRGCALVPADRNGEGAVGSMDLRENLFMNPRSRVMRPIRRQQERREAADLLESFDVRPPEPSTEFSTLSGGNAQKVVLARCLSSSPRLLVLEEPTAAVDVGARAEIHQRIREIAKTGPAVVLVSSDLEEIEQVCDRAVVMERGRVQRVLEGTKVTASALLEAAYGISNDD
jgi:ribose transport system ATP-binding protein